MFSKMCLPILFLFYFGLSSSSSIRQTFGGGRWFSASKAALRAEIDSYFRDANVEPIKGRIVAGLTPHAGFSFSGATVAYTFKAIASQKAENQPEVIVIIGFPHHEHFNGIALMEGTAIDTPLGRHPLDVEATQFLSKQPGFFFGNKHHEGEHSAENEIPFLQVALPLVPICVALVGDGSSSTQAMADALVALNRVKRLVAICSTDMLHDTDYDLVYRTDTNTLKLTADMDIEGLNKAWSYDFQIYCGIRTVLAGMMFSRALGVKKAVVLKHACSGDSKPASQRGYNVGYGAVVMPLPLD